MARPPKILPAMFYQSAGGGEPVRDWLKGMEQADRRAIGSDIATVECGWPVGMPTCRSLGDGLWEVRTKLAQGRIARVIFVIFEERMVLLHAFIKKTAKTPKAELDLARTRKKELKR
ncbi:MAG: type II toxin-antitoxin system RelE/ParE family toxin [Hyphomonadaceae bacterium]|nr:type II toxin-antitoxin system RelE/ParE family toxin [Hyphomonadaceae bacterium]